MKRIDTEIKKGEYSRKKMTVVDLVVVNDKKSAYVTVTLPYSLDTMKYYLSKYPRTQIIL